MGQLGSKNLASFGVDRQVQFPPSPSLRWLSQVSDMNPETRAIDEQMDRLIVPHSTKSNVIELLETPRQSGMIRDREIQFEQLGQGTQEPFGLPERKVEDYAEGEPCLNRYVRVGALAARLSAGWLPPGFDRIF
jgi:hypothetical protein